MYVRWNARREISLTEENSDHAVCMNEWILEHSVSSVYTMSQTFRDFVFFSSVITAYEWPQNLSLAGVEAFW